jgi:hypothetical protein
MSDLGPVQVELNTRHRPASFAWHDKAYRVKTVQECWRLMGAWWDDKGEQTFFRVLTDGGGIYELRFDHAGSEWRMSAVCD